MFSFKNLKFLFFPLLMSLLGTLTVLKYKEINDFKQKSQEYNLVLSANSDEIKAIKSDLQNITYQIVLDEVMSDGFYKLTFRCPPEKIKFLKEYLKKKGKKEVEEDQK